MRIITDTDLPGALRRTPLLALLTGLLAVLAAGLDRIGILQLAAIAAAPEPDWPVGLLQALVALVGGVLFARWAGLLGLRAVGQQIDHLVGRAVPTRREAPLPAAWSDAAAAVREDARRLVAALPPMLATLVTIAWLALHHTLAVLVITVCCLGVSTLARPRLARQRAGAAVWTAAEAAFDRMVGALAAAGNIVLVGVGPARGFAERALAPPIDDSTRAAAVQLQDSAFLSGLAFWLGMLVIALLIILAPAADAGWTAAVILVAATLDPARRTIAALPAVTGLQERFAELARRAAAPAAPAAAPVPSRLRTLALRQLRLARQEGAAGTLNALGPLDLELRFGEILAVTGPDRLDGEALLLFLAGQAVPEAGGCFLDERPMTLPFPRGLCGGVFAGAELPPPGSDTTPRVTELLARFDLPAGLAAGAAPTPLAAWEQARWAFVAAELQDRPIRLCDTRLLRWQPHFLAAHLDTLREARARGRLCLLATDHPEFLAIADRILHFEDGRLIAGGGTP
ncbi:MAG: hypothetical protein ACOYOH_16235 [Paracraurococcus sp.]